MISIFRILANLALHACLFLLLILLIHVSPSAMADGVDSDMKYPGILVDIGTHKMHLNCQGIYPPTIVIDSGLGGFSLEWDTLQKKLSAFNRVCTYDRSGYGWSEESPLPRTSKVIANELYLLLTKAGITGPFIMVGHSFGGYNIRYFASQHPELVSGMVFIDSSHPQQFERMPKTDTRMENISRQKVWKVKLAIPTLSDNFPSYLRSTAFVLMYSNKSRRTQISELENFRISARQVLENDHLPDVPVIVITHGMRIWPDTDFGKRSEKVWLDLQDEIAALGKDSIHLIAVKSGHSVHLDQPLLVYTAISDMAKPSNPLQYSDTLYVNN